MSTKPFIGSTAKIFYKGGPSGEEPQDICENGEPLTIVIGSLSVPVPFEEALLQMERGEERTIEIPAKEGFGPYEKKYVEWYPRAMLPDGYNLVVGSVLSWQPKGGGSKVPARVTDATQDMVQIDLNHPMAGKDLTYWIKLIDFE